MIDVSLVVGFVVFALAGRFWIAMIAFWVVGGLRSVREPVSIAWINQGLDPGTRATINSMGAQADAVGQATGGPVLGVIANSVAVPAAIVVSGLVQLPSLLLYRRAITRGSAGTLEPEQIESRLDLDDESVG